MFERKFEKHGGCAERNKAHQYQSSIMSSVRGKPLENNNFIRRQRTGNYLYQAAVSRCNAGERVIPPRHQCGMDISGVGAD